MLHQELSKLESLWRRREVNNLEKAAKMIALIVEAQEKFKDEQSRRDYDLQLDQSKRKSKQFDPNVERIRSFMDWRNKTVSFYDERQYDLAKSALDKALSYMPTDYEDSLFFNQAALIYVDNNDCNAAMDYINRAIIIDIDTPDYYLTKGLVFNSLANGQYVNFSDKQTFLEKSEKMFLKAHELAAQKNISVVRANVAGALALYYSFINDETKAETLAQEAVQYSDPWGNGQKVLNIIKRRREDREREKQEEWKHLIKFNLTPLILILAVVGTFFSSYVESAYIFFFATLGIVCNFSIIFCCVCMLPLIGNGAFTLLIVLIILQIISRSIGKNKGYHKRGILGSLCVE